jgi:hypothetical protein
MALLKRFIQFMQDSIGSSGFTRQRVLASMAGAFTFFRIPPNSIIPDIKKLNVGIEFWLA